MHYWLRWPHQGGDRPSPPLELPEDLVPVAHVHGKLVAMGDDLVGPGLHNGTAGVMEMLLQWYGLVCGIYTSTVAARQLAAALQDNLPCLEGVGQAKLVAFLEQGTMPAWEMAGALEALLDWHPEMYGIRSVAVEMQYARVKRAAMCACGALAIVVILAILFG